MVIPRNNKTFMNTQKIQEMFDKEDMYWWFAARRAMVLHLLKTYVKKGSKLLDAGCGTGLLTKTIDKQYKVTAIDVDPISLKLTKQRKPKATVLYANMEKRLKFPKETFDAVTLLDVLEHIDDEKALSHLYRVMKPKGMLVITVPAYPWLFSYWDILHQHKRRYTYSQLYEVLRKHGFEVIHHSYFNTFLFPFILCVRLLKSLWKQTTTQTDCYELPRKANTLLLKIFQKETLFATTHTIPFGLSVLVIAQKIKK